MQLNKSIPWIAAGLAFTAGKTVLAENKQQLPNIIVILCDDLGYGDLSCQRVTNDIHTPHIDKLLNEGIRCTNFYANSPVSSPSRAALLTGCFPDNVGVPGVIRTHPEDSWGYLSEKALLLPEIIKQKNYHSALIGKWHLGLESPNTPQERGFDHFHGFLGDMMDDYYNHLRWGNNYMRLNNEIINPQGHATELFTDWAIQYVTERNKTGNPYFLYLAYNAPHVPVQPPQEWFEKVKTREKGITDTRAKLVALIEHMDSEIGRLYHALEQDNQLENTFIVFTSDNGGQADAGAINRPFRGAKEDMYEGGIHVPAGFYWKGTIQPAVSENMILLSDIFPTVCEITELTIPETIDGVSIYPLLQGKNISTDNRMVYWVRREGNERYGGKAYYASRKGNYKILQNTPWEPIQLFDLANDPAEQNPLQINSSGEYKELFNGLMQHIRKTGAMPWQSPTKK